MGLLGSKRLLGIGGLWIDAADGFLNSRPLPMLRFEIGQSRFEGGKVWNGGRWSPVNLSRLRDFYWSTVPVYLVLVAVVKILTSIASGCGGWARCTASCTMAAHPG